MLAVRIFLLGLSGVIIFFSDGYSQTFVKADSLIKGAYGAAAWGDFDNDGRKDIVYISQTIDTINPDIFNVYRNTGTGFEITASFPMLFTPAIAWGDLNNDGFEDFVASGLDMTVGNSKLNIYVSNGDGTFVVIDTLPGFSAGAIAIADYDNDGLNDFVASGYNLSSQREVILFKNEGSLNFSIATHNFEALPAGEMKWCDFNNDGFADLSLTGDGVFSRTYLYKNNGGGSFTLSDNQFKGGRGTIDWLDLNSDGWEDLFVSGVDSTAAFTYTNIYLNNGDETFTEAMTNFPKFGEPSAADVADFNNDGVPDIFIAGGNELFFEHFSCLALTNTATSFTLSQLIHADIMNCIVEAADYDNDGDADLLVGHVIWENTGELSVFSLKQSLIQLYPNPSDEYVIITTDEDDIPAQIYSTQGQKIIDLKLKKGDNKIALSGFSSGNYLVRIQKGNAVQVEKMIFVKP